MNDTQPNFHILLNYATKTKLFWQYNVWAFPYLPPGTIYAPLDPCDPLNVPPDLLRPLTHPLDPLRLPICPPWPPRIQNFWKTMCDSFNESR